MTKSYGQTTNPPSASQNRTREAQIKRYIATHKSKAGTISTVVNHPSSPTPKLLTGTSRRQSALNGFARAIGLGGVIADNSPSTAPRRKPHS